VCNVAPYCEIAMAVKVERFKIMHYHILSVILYVVFFLEKSCTF